MIDLVFVDGDASTTYEAIVTRKHATLPKAFTSCPIPLGHERCGERFLEALSLAGATAWSSMKAREMRDGEWVDERDAA